MLLQKTLLKTLAKVDSTISINEKQVGFLKSTDDYLLYIDCKDGYYVEYIKWAGQNIGYKKSWKKQTLKEAVTIIEEIIKEI